MNESSQRNGRAGIAIVGLAGRFPGAPTVKEFWRNLTAGVESITFATDDELSSAGVDPKLAASPDYVPASSVIRETEYFDASFFGFSAREAEIIDPQQRIFLECAWEALEDAAHDASSYPGAIGVFAGAGVNTYGLANLFSNPDVVESVGPYQIMVGNDKDFLCSRVSYKLNLRGPAVGVQTACSTSLVAVQMAFESLQRHECDMALAGGVSIPAQQSMGYVYVPGMIYSRDGHCRAFDAAASGIVPAGGAGVVLLKRLDDAITDSDHIYAVIRGAAINNDGSSKVGYSAPSIEGQATVIQKSMEIAGFAPESIGYVEGHGTGTEVGDPIEVAALAKAFHSVQPGSASCALGSVKSNIGHLDTAAGVTGLIKAALTLKHRTIPATLHFTRANPLIDFDATPFYVNNSVQEYRKPGPFRAGVSSFGIGGTNAHVSLEEAPAMTSDASHASQLIVLSAKTAGALDRQATRLSSYLEENSSVNLADLAFTLQKGRQAFRHRRVMVASDTIRLKSDLQGPPSSPANPPQLRSGNIQDEPAGVAFLFPGQGSQYVNMGRDLYQTVPKFREVVDHCCEILRPLIALDLRDVLYPGAGAEPEAERSLSQTAITQPAIFVIEYAMAQIWMDCGVHPSAMLGHSIGEYVAACVGGVFSLKDALMLVATRGRMIQALPSGAMLAVHLSEQDLEPLLIQEVSVAAINSPGQTVASGPGEAISVLEATLKNKKIECKRLRTSHAFHSSMMEEIVGEYMQQVEKIERRAPKIRFLSNVTGTWITDRQAIDPAYWGSHLRNTVRFADCARNLLGETGDTLLEVGPGDTLLSLLRAQLGPRGTRSLIPSMRHHLATKSDRDVWLEALGRLWLLNTPLNWDGLYREEKRVRLSLPTYPFERQRYWIEPKKSAAVPAPPDLTKRPDIADWFYVPSWRRSVTQLLAEAAINPADTWLFLEPDGALADAVAAGLGLHANVVRVRIADTFRQVSAAVFEINPGSRDDYGRLMQSLQESGRWPDRILHGWMANPGVQINSNEALNRSIFSAMFLLQATGEISSAQKIELNILSNRAYSVFGERVSSPVGGALSAFGKVIALEYSNVICRSIDIDVEVDVKSAAAQLLRELETIATNEVIAYRGSTRWVQQYDPVRLEKPAVEAASRQIGSALHLRQGGTYLITGGLGGVGLVLAQHLSQTAHARIILTSRTPLPAASEWNAVLAATDTTEALRQKIRGLQALEASGSEVLVFQADTNNLEAMREVLSVACKKFGAVHGIIHAAGIAGVGLTQTKSCEQASAVLSPKVQGVEWIREEIPSGNLDFVLLCSSISAVIPSYGLSDYAAANAYLDGFAAMFDNPSGTRVISANWDTWRDVGMAVDAFLPEALSHLRQDGLKHGIQSSEAAEVFDRLLASPLPQVLISTRDFRVLERQTAERIASISGDLHRDIEGGSMAVHGRPDSLDNFVAAQDDVEQHIVTVWEELLGIHPIGIHDDFFKLGGHSLLATQVMARLRERFNVDLSLRTIFEAATPAQLAAHIRVTSWAANTPSSVASLEREEIEI